MKNWLVALLVMVGIFVGMVSIYFASLSGVMGKMGLVGGDFSQAVDTNKLARLIAMEGKSIDCGIWSVGRRIPEYFLAEGNERIRLSGELGGERVVCGVNLVQRGNVERGVYTIIKGLYYLKSHYADLRAQVERDKEQCNMLQNPEYERWVEGYLMATEGRVQELVSGVYEQVVVARAKVEELCIE